MNYTEDRWYHIYLYLITYTSVLSSLYALMTEWTITSVVIAFGVMGILSAICFLTEFAVMGLTAKAGGFFWTAVTCFLVTHYLLLHG